MCMCNEGCIIENTYNLYLCTYLHTYVDTHVDTERVCYDLCVRLKVRNFEERDLRSDWWEKRDV